MCAARVPGGPRNLSPFFSDSDGSGSGCDGCEFGSSVASTKPSSKLPKEYDNGRTLVYDGATLHTLYQKMLRLRPSGLPEEFYRENAEKTIGGRVEAFVYHKKTKAYLLCDRVHPIGRDVKSMLGGRHKFSKDILGLAVDSCFNKLGLTVKAVDMIFDAGRVYMSKYGFPAHDMTEVVLVIDESEECRIPKLDPSYRGYQWISIEDQPEDPFFEGSLQRSHQSPSNVWRDNQGIEGF